MRGLSWVGMGFLLLFGRVSAAEEKPTPKAAPAPVFPTPGKGEGILVGTLGMAEFRPSYCTWNDLRLRSVPAREGEEPVERSFPRKEVAAGSFGKGDRRRELFVFSVPSGRYELSDAQVVCSDYFTKSRFTSSEDRPFKFDVAPGKITYLGAISFDSIQSGYTVQNQWDRDSRVLESHYPLVDWDRTVMSDLVARLRPALADSLLPRTLDRLLEDPLPSRPGTPPPELADVGADLPDFEKSCAKGCAADCFNLGLLFLLDQDDLDSEQRAARLFEKACAGSVAEGCFNAGTLWAQGRGVEWKNPGRAADFFQQACEKGLEWGCLSLGKLHEQGVGAASPSQRREKALRLYERVCTRGIAEGCFAQGLIHARNRGSAKDETRAATLLQKGCTGGHPVACIAAEQLSRQRENATASSPSP